MLSDHATNLSSGRSSIRSENLIRILTLLISVLLVCCSHGRAVPSPKKATRITIAGSSAMLPLVTEAANRYMHLHPDIAIDVSAGGSARGIDCALRGECSIGTSDVAAGAEVRGKLEDHLAAVTGFATMANRGPFNEKIQSLTLTQLKGIFSGLIKNSSEIGGSPQPIIVINRRKGSGTRVNFGNIVLGGDNFVQGLEEESSALVRTMLEQTIGAISYLGVSYRRDSLVCFNVDGIAPTNNNIAAGSYPIWSNEHMYTLGPATGGIKDFLDFMLTPEVQNKIVPSSGFLPIAQMRGKGRGD